MKIESIYIIRIFLLSTIDDIVMQFFCTALTITEDTLVDASLTHYLS